MQRDRRNAAVSRAYKRVPSISHLIARYQHFSVVYSTSINLRQLTHQKNWRFIVTPHFFDISIPCCQGPQQLIRLALDGAHSCQHQNLGSHEAFRPNLYLTSKRCSYQLTLRFPEPCKLREHDDTPPAKHAQDIAISWMSVFRF